MFIVRAYVNVDVRCMQAYILVDYTLNSRYSTLSALCLCMRCYDVQNRCSEFRAASAHALFPSRCF